MLFRLTEHVCHHGSGLSGPHRTVTGNDMVIDLAVSAALIHLCP